MPQEITIDGSGRLVIPKSSRRLHHLEAGSRLTLIDEDDRLILIPVQTDPKLVEQDGLLVLAGTEGHEIPDHRTLREERVEKLHPLE